MFGNITDEIAEQFEADFEEDSDSEESDEKENLFDAIVDREARRILFDLLHITYHFIRVYKAAQINEIITTINEKFEVNTVCFVFCFLFPFQSNNNFVMQVVGKKKGNKSF